MLILSIIIALCFGVSSCSIAGMIKGQKKMLKIKNAIQDIDKKINELEGRVDKHSESIAEITYGTQDTAPRRKIYDELLVDAADFPAALNDNLKKAGIYTVRDLVGKSKKQIMKINGVGLKSMKKIHAFLKDNQLTLKS